MDTRLNGLKGWDKEDLEDIIRNNVKYGYTDDFPEVAGEYLGYIIGVFDNEYLEDHEFQDPEYFKDCYSDLAQDYYDNKLIWDDDIKAIKETELSFEDQNDEYAKEKAFESFKNEMEDIAFNTFCAFIQDDKTYNWRGLDRSRTSILFNTYGEGEKKDAKSSLKSTLITSDYMYKEGFNNSIIYEFNSGDTVEIVKGKDARDFNVESIKNDLRIEDLRDEHNFFNMWNYFYAKNYEDEELATQDVIDAYRISWVQDGIEGDSEQVKELSLIKQISEKYLEEQKLFEEKERELELAGADRKKISIDLYNLEKRRYFFKEENRENQEEEEMEM